MNRRLVGAYSKRLSLELLEDRRVLATTPIISEFMASNSTSLLDGDGQSSDWVEIYNPTSSAIDLSGWKLTDNAGNLSKWTFPSATIAAGGFLVVFASDKTVPDYIDPLGYRHTTYALSAGGEYLGLIDPMGTIVSQFAPKFPAQSTDVSYGLDGAGLGTYFNHATPGAANDLASAVSRGVVISEIMYHPSSELATEEYIEIYNGEPTTVNLTGWTLGGGVEFVFPTTTLAPGAYLAVAADVAAFSVKYPSVSNFVGGWTSQLSNRGENIMLLDSTGRGIDSVAYYDEGDWTDRELGPLDHAHRGWVWSDAHDGAGSSLELISFGTSNDFGQSWAASITPGGTPGASNSVHDADNNVAPLVIDISHTPAIPRSTDPVVITARLVDEQSTGLSATLFWRVDGAASFASAPMADNGIGPDAKSGDQVFSVLLPAMANGTVVEFYVQSADSAGNLRTYPSPSLPSGQQLTNLLYQVDNSFDPNSLPGPGDMPEYRLIMTNAERAELAQINTSTSDRYSHARMNGTFVSVSSSGVEVRYRVGIRNRGAGSSNRLPQSYHIDIPRDDTWQGLEAFNLNTQHTQNQLAGLKLFGFTGEVVEDARAVKVRVNGTDLSNAGSPSYGVYVQLESSDAVFVANHYPEDDNGNLYKAIRDDAEVARADFRDLGTDPAAYAVYYEKQTNTSENNYSDLLELIQVLNYEPDATFYAKLQQIVDIDQWLNYFATVAILGSEETSIGTGVGDDFMLYRGAKDPRFQLIPHDFDTILGLGDTTGSATSSIYRAAAIPAIGRIIYNPQVLPEYHEKLRELLTTTFEKVNFDSILDQELSGFATVSHIASMKSFMDARRTHILGLVTKPLSIQANLSTVGGFPRTTQDNAALSGTAQLAEVQSVTAGGLVTEFNRLTGVWSIGQASGSITNFVQSGDIWHYLDAGAIPSITPSSDWRVDDPNWVKSGPSQLGYGDTQRTVVQFVDTDPVTSGTQKNITTYFRKTFNVSNAANYSDLSLRLLRDDGAVVYLNGKEVLRSNIAANITVTPTTLASPTVGGADEERFYEFPLDPADLIEGENVIAVEIHQDGTSSTDIGFDLEMSGTIGNLSSTDGVPLTPGINRIKVVAYDGPNGTGVVIESKDIDVWYDDGSVTNVGGIVTTKTVWSAANGPYVVTSDLFVEGTGTLVIEPGTTVFFNVGSGLTVRNGGQIIAEGTENERIRFAHNPANGTGAWDGLTFTNTAQDNRLTYIDMQSGAASGRALLVDSARLLIDQASWIGISNQVIDLAHPNLIVRNSLIPGISGNETVHLFGLNQGEQLVFENNIVGFNSSGGDVMDFGHDTLTPATIVIRGNTFLGGFDDGVDTDGFPVLIENNTFQNFHYNTSRTTTSNAVSSGHMNIAGQNISSNLTLRNNTFFNNDHHLLLKDNSFATLEHNTMVDATLSAIHFAEPGGTDVIGPGRGANITGNIFWGTGLALESNTASTELTLDYSIVPAELVILGTGNLTGDPLLQDPAVGDFSLLQGSLGLDTGPGGTDIGAWQAPHYVAASAANLRVTEIHYHPLSGDKVSGEIGGDSDFLEFIELRNMSDAPIDLSDVAFDDGIDFKFPWLASLKSHEVVVLAKNLDLFRSRYGSSIRVAGEYAGQLANSGERLRLIDATGQVITEFTYDDAAPWPISADGDGESLELASAAGNPNSAASWRASSSIGGTPGAFGSSADYNGNGLVDGRDFLIWQRQFGAAGPGLSADGNRDNVVDAADLNLWQDSYGTTVPASFTPSADYNGNGLVDGADFLIWQRQLGATGPGHTADGTRDNIVDAADLTLWQISYGTTIPLSFAATAAVHSQLAGNFVDESLASRISETLISTSMDVNAVPTNNQLSLSVVFVASLTPDSKAAIVPDRVRTIDLAFIESICQPRQSRRCDKSRLDFPKSIETAHSQLDITYDRSEDDGVEEAFASLGDESLVDGKPVYCLTNIDGQVTGYIRQRKAVQE